MKRGYWLYTIERNGIKQTIVDQSSNPVIFLSIEKEVGHSTVILHSIEISSEDYYYYHNN